MEISEMECNNEAISNSLLMDLLKIAQDATPGSWETRIYEYAKSIVKPNHHINKEEHIAECIEGLRFGFRSFQNHIRLFITSKQSDAIYICNFYPQRVEMLINELISLNNFIINIQNIQKACKFDKVILDLLKRRCSDNNIYQSNTYLTTLLRLTECATPGPYMHPKIFGFPTMIVQSSWKWNLDNCIYDKNFKRLRKYDYHGENFAFNLYKGRIYLCKAIEHQHISNTKYITAFNPSIAILLIKNIVECREILVNIYNLSNKLELDLLDDDSISKLIYVNKISEL